MMSMVKNDIRQDVWYTINLIGLTFLMIAALTVFWTIGHNADSSTDGYSTFYRYIVVLLVIFHGIYGCSKARMDRFYAMRINRKVFYHTCLLTELLNAVILTVVYGGMGFVGMMFQNSSVLYFRTLSETMSWGENNYPFGLLIFTFMLALTIRSQMLFDFSTNKSAITATAYLASPSIWTMDNRKKSQERGGNRALYMVTFLIYVIAGYICMFLVSYSLKLLAIIVAILVVYNVFLLVSAKKKMMRKDIL